MAYYFSCKECNTTSLFDNGSVTNLDPNKQYHLIENVKGGYINTKENESVICKSCISKKVRLKGNYIII